MATRTHLRLLGPLVGSVVALTGVLTVAGPASADNPVASPPGPPITRLGSGALRITYKGHDYTCLPGDLCVWRGGTYATYYKCQTVGNATTANGWSVNNQSNPGGTASFHAKPPFSSVGQPIGTSYTVIWGGVSSFTTCS